MANDKIHVSEMKLVYDNRFDRGRPREKTRIYVEDESKADREFVSKPYTFYRKKLLPLVVRQFGLDNAALLWRNSIGAFILETDEQVPAQEVHYKIK